MLVSAPQVVILLAHRPPAQDAAPGSRAPTRVHSAGTRELQGPAPTGSAEATAKGQDLLVPRPGGHTGQWTVPGLVLQPRAALCFSLQVLPTSWSFLLSAQSKGRLPGGVGANRFLNADPRLEGGAGTSVLISGFI